MPRKFLLGLVFLSFLFLQTGYAQGEDDLTPGEEIALVDEKPQEKEYVPWMIGHPLIPSGYAIPRGHYRVLTNVFLQNRYGEYGRNWDPHHIRNFLVVNTSLAIKFGLNQFMDFEIRPQMFYRHTQGQSTTNFGDLLLGINIQLYKYGENSQLPSVKLLLQEVFPTGKYQHLNPAKKRTDRMGDGSFITRIGLVFSHLYHFKKHNFLEARSSIIWHIPSSVHVHGYNRYGGAAATRGKVYPGQEFWAAIGVLYTLNQRWVIVTDIQYQHENTTRFSGNRGYLPSGELAPMKKRSTERIVCSPQLQYNWSAVMGVAAAPWFSVAGRNTPQFNGGIFTFRYYH